MNRQSAAARRQPASAPPGIGLALATATICGVMCWFWLASGQANSLKPTAPNSSDLAEVDERELDGALTTMSASNAMLAQVRVGKDGRCRRPLAWVSVVSAPGARPSRIRLISGTYYSPVFEVSTTPVRVAMPFPAPYETGHGVLRVIDVGDRVTISLIPAWHLSPQDGKSTRAVTWHPVTSCSPRNG